MTDAPDARPIRYIRPGMLFESIQKFDARHAVTRGEFSIDVPGHAKDMEWNHMDQLHRQHIHHTYQDNLRIALGRDFAVSLTRWGRWPFLITVTDSRVAEGVFYQDMVLAGLFYIHNTITLTEKDEVVRMHLVWHINSHRFLKPLHAILSRMFYTLNVRLQEEDSVIRRQRYRLRKEGYGFRSDPPDYYTSNSLRYNTVYPDIAEGASIALGALPFGAMVPCRAGGLEFLVWREPDEVRLWPSACPHEGGALARGKNDENCRIECPWHGLKISSARLSALSPAAEQYGFRYVLEHDIIHIRKS